MNRQLLDLDGALSKLVGFVGESVSVFVGPRGGRPAAVMHGTLRWGTTYDDDTGDLFFCVGDDRDGGFYVLPSLFVGGIWDERGRLGITQQQSVVMIERSGLRAWMARAGEPVTTIQAWLGHGDLRPPSATCTTRGRPTKQNA